MKKLLFFAALVLGTVSCMKDNSFEANAGGEADVVLSVALPADVTRAMDNDSAKGAIGNIDLAQYDIRYILEVFDANDDLAKRVEKYEDTETSTTFELRLIPGRHYSFVVWADFVAQGSEDALHYNAEDLRNIEIIGEQNAMDESRDAYTGIFRTSDNGGQPFSSSSQIGFELKRPFAKLRVVTNDIDEIYSSLVGATIEYTADTYQKYDALTKQSSELATKTKSVDYTSEAYLYDGEPTTEGEQTLFADYILGTQNGTVQFIMTVEDSVQALPAVNFNTAIPVQTNYLTTIYGPILTDYNNVTVTINPAFEEPEHIVEHKKASTAEQLNEIFTELNESTTNEEVHIVLGDDINLDDLASLFTTRASSSTSITIAEGKEVVLDIKNYSITGTDNETASFGLFNIQPGAKFTIEGTTGKIQLTATKNRGWNAYSSVISNQRGEFVLNGGTIEHLGGTDMAYGLDILTNTGAGDAKATINGGVVKSPYRAIRQFLNSTKATVELVVNGGTIDGRNNKSIWMQNANKSVNPGKLVVGENANLYGDVMVSGSGAPELAIELSVAVEALKDNATVIPSNIPADYAIYVKNDAYVVEKGVEVNGDEISICNAAGLKYVADKVNSGADYFAGKTIVLANDIDLNNEEWAPIGSATKDHGFMGNFDGRGYAIKNLTIKNITPDSDGYVYGGLFGVTEGVDKDNQNYIKNLTIENVNINLNGHIVAAVIAYPYYTNVENITVKGNVNIKGRDYTAGVLAYTRRCVDAENISIKANEGSVIEGTQTVGGIISDIQTNGGLKANYSNFAASGLTVKGSKMVGGISGIICNQTLNGAAVENVTIVCDDVRKGAISGALGGASVITEAEVNNVAGAERLIGSTYDSGDECTVTINGVVYEYLASGACKVDGKVVVDNNDQFQKAIAEGANNIVLGKGTFDLPSSLTQTEGTLTIKGRGNDVTVLNGAVNTNGNHPGNYTNGVALEFEGLTFKTANNGYNGGFGHAVSVTFRESKIVGQFYAHSSAPHYFYNCTIDPLTGYLYTYGSDCVFEGCTFAASEGKALQVYNDSATGENTVTITNCAFVAAKQATTWDGKPVTGIDINSNGAKFEVYINNCTTTGFPTGLNSNSDLWNVKDAGKAHANVYVDGVQVW